MVTHPRESARLLRRLHIAALPVRLRILALLQAADGPLRVTEITHACPGSQQPEISHHLKILREAGILTATKASTRVYYELADPELMELLLALQQALTFRHR